MARRSPSGMVLPEPVTDPGLASARVAELGFAGLRIAVGLLMVWYGVQEHFGVFLAPGTEWRGGLVPFSDPWIMATTRLACGVLLVLGLFARSAAIILASHLVLLRLATEGSLALRLDAGGQLLLVLAFVLIMFATTGAGRLSLDMLRAARRARRRPGSGGMTVEMSPWVRRQIRRRELSR